MEPIIIGESIKICQINVEGASVAKSDYLSRLAFEHKVGVITIQESHINDGREYNSRGSIDGYVVAAYVLSPIYGAATYVRSDIVNFKVLHLSNVDNISLIVVEVEGIQITNVYKPPNVIRPLIPIAHQFVQHPAICIGDFNSHHMSWGYNLNDVNGDKINDWSDLMNLFLVFDAKDRSTFHSARWRSNTNPDLCFLSRNERDIPMSTSRKVLPSFPRSQHRPIIIEIGTKIHLVDSKQKPRWNFKKANWDSFSKRVDAAIRFVPCEIKNYHRFIGIVKSAAKKSIPRGYRKKYVPGWTAEMETLFREYESGNDPEIADELLDMLMAAKRMKWEEATSNMDFKRFSRKSWALLRTLGEADKPVDIKFTVDPEKMATNILKNSKKVKGDKTKSRKIRCQLRRLKASLPEHSPLDDPFSIEEIKEAISCIKVGKAASLDGMYPEFIKYLGKRTLWWLLKFFNKILKTSNLPALLKKINVIAVLKQGKEADDPESYRPIVLLSVIYKLLERLIGLRINESIEAVVPRDQPGFQKDRSCTEQALALTSFIESGFEQNKKISVVFVDLSVAYESVWRIGFMLKYYKAVPSRKMGRLVNNMLSNRYIRVIIGRQSSSWKRINNGFAQGGVNSPRYFNLYTSDMPETFSRKFPFADDLAMAIQTQTFLEGEEFLSADLATMDEYYYGERLCLNPDKTVASVFHLNNQKANEKLKITLGDKVIPFDSQPKYLGSKLDRPLTHQPHVDKTCQKLKSRINIIRKLAGTRWGANAHTLRTAALALVYSTAEFNAPVWYRSAHAYKVDNLLHETMRIVAGVVHSTPIPWLHALSNIAPPHLRREKAAHKLWRKCTEHPNLADIPLRHDLLNPPPDRLISRKPIWKDAKIRHPNYSIDEEWRQYWNDSPDFSNKDLITDPTCRVEGFSLPRRDWKTLNRFRTGHGCCAEQMVRWNFANSTACDCDGSTVQSMKHLIDDCPNRYFNGGIETLHSLSDEALGWLTNFDLNI